MMIVTTAQLYPNVVLGPDVEMQEFVVLGVPPRGCKPGELSTFIGKGAVLRSHTVIYAGNRIGDSFQTGHAVLIREDSEIGDYVSIGSHSVVEHHVQIADNVRIHSQVFIPEFTVLETGAWLGPNVVLTNARFPLGYKVKEKLKSPWVGPRAKIGANATILPGVRIGAEALVGAGAVVTCDVPDGEVVIGNPARIVKRVEELFYPEDPSIKPYGEERG